jgi:serine protease AprX
MAPVTIHGNIIDPDEDRYTSRDAEKTNYIYVQGHHLLDNDEKLQLQALDAHVLAFEGDNTYLCRYPPTDLGPLRKLPFVKHANAYHKVFKTSANLGERLQNGGLAHVTIALHDGARSTQEVEALLRDIDGVSNESMTAYDDHVTADITPEALAQLEALDDIKMIELKPKSGLMNDQADLLVGANQLVSLKAQGGRMHDGSKQLVTVADTGFDRGSITDKHLAFAKTNVQLLPIGRPNQSNDPHGHGTHVAASVLGSGACTDLAGATATNGPKSASILVQGTAPAADLLLQSLLTSDGGLETKDISKTLLKVAYDDPYRSRIHTNS